MSAGGFGVGEIHNVLEAAGMGDIPVIFGPKQ